MQESWLGVWGVRVQPLEVLVNMAIGDEAIGPAVVSKSLKVQPQPTQSTLSWNIPLVRDPVLEESRAQVDEEGHGFVPVVGDKECRASRRR